MDSGEIDHLLLFIGKYESILRFDWGDPSEKDRALNLPRAAGLLLPHLFAQDICRPNSRPFTVSQETLNIGILLQCLFNIFQNIFIVDPGKLRRYKRSKGILWSSMLFASRPADSVVDGINTNANVIKPAVVGWVTKIFYVAWALSAIPQSIRRLMWRTYVAPPGAVVACGAFTQ